MSEILYTARFDSGIGSTRVASTERGLAYVELPHASGRGFDGWRRRHLPDAPCREGFVPNREVVRQLTEFLEGKRRVFDLPLDLRGTPFQLGVWHALLDIPYGEKQTYAALAAKIGRPNAVRAVGSANGANPVSLVVPCHRVVATGGKLGGYGGGLRLKEKLLAMEGSGPSEGRLL